MKRKLSDKDKKAKVPKLNPSTSTEVIECGSFENYMKDIEKRRNKCFINDYVFNKTRVLLKCGSNDWNDDKKSVLYWMSRDQRVQDNWAFIYAQKLALKLHVDLHVCFCLVPKFLDATIRHYMFMLKGLEEVEQQCRDVNIGFHLLTGDAKSALPPFINQYEVGSVVTDFSPLRVPLQWVTDVINILPDDISLYQVDAHNVIPVWEASPKLEVGARTIRSKINRKIDEYLTEFPPIIKHPGNTNLPLPIDWSKAKASIEVDESVKEVTSYLPGYQKGIHNLWTFINSDRLVKFNVHRNDPTKSCLSNISPWLHFGQVGAQRCILEVRSQRKRAQEGVDIFVEEALVRRELADNFCYYNKDYDNIKGAWQWAQTSLQLHNNDKRPYSYSLDELERARTHDKLWNAAQLQMVREGKMHGFLRMYWAKKILEWTSAEDGGAEESLRRALYLNDRYNLDGRDPNGYVGVMWSICGVHDQGWREREIFGKVRYMNYKGCLRKFDVGKFEKKYC